MKNNIILLLVVLFLITITDRLIFGESNCKVGSKPKLIPCPAQDSYNCSDGLKYYKLQKEWVKSEPDGTLGPKITPSSPDAPGSYELEFIVKTGATCGGRSIEPSAGFFGSQRTDGDDDYVKPGADSECYREYDCNWNEAGTIHGYIWETHNTGLSSEYKKARERITTQYRCDKEGEVTVAPWPAVTVISASWDDCFGDDDDDGD